MSWLSVSDIMISLVPDIEHEMRNSKSINICVFFVLLYERITCNSNHEMKTLDVCYKRSYAPINVCPQRWVGGDTLGIRPTKVTSPGNSTEHFDGTLYALD